MPEDKVPPVHSASIKLPPYWAQDPTIWFLQVEAQFVTRGITAQATKYAYIVAALQPSVAIEVRDLLVKPPENNPYDLLKSELIKRTQESEQNRLQKLLISEELGDRKPSQLLRRMNQLLSGNTLDEGMFKQLFLQRLPSSARLILSATSDSVSIEQLANTADKILEVTCSPNILSVNAASNVTPVAPAFVNPPSVSEVVDRSVLEDLRRVIFRFVGRGAAVEDRSE